MKSIRILLVLVAIFCWGGNASAGMPKEYYSSGFFGKGYTQTEMEKAPAHDINNGKINVTFIVDNPQNPTRFYGSYLTGHAESNVCARVSHEQIEFAKAFQSSGNTLFHLGFGMTNAFDESLANSESLAKLYNWYKDPQTQDPAFSRQVLTHVISLSQYKEELAQFKEWKKLASGENILIALRNVPKHAEPAGDFRLPKQPDISHLFLTEGEIKIVKDYMDRIADQVYDQLKLISFDAPYLKDKLERIKSEELKLRDEFLAQHKIASGTKLHDIIIKLDTPVKSFELYAFLRELNEKRRDILKSPEWIGLDGVKEFEIIFRIIDEFLKTIDERKFVTILKGSPNFSFLKRRTILEEGRQDIELLAEKVKINAELLQRLSEGITAGSGQEKVKNLLSSYSRLLAMHFLYLSYEQEDIEDKYAQPNEKQSGVITTMTLSEQEGPFFNSLYGRHLKFRRAYDNDSIGGYQSFFSEKNTALTTPLFLDALSRGWPGDDLLVGDKSQSVSEMITVSLQDIFGKDTYSLLIRKPNTFFSYSSNGQEGKVMQSIGGDILLAGIPEKNAKKDGKHLVFALDPWNYRREDKDQRAVTVPAVDKLIEAESLKNDLGQLYHSISPVNVIDPERKSITVYYGSFEKPHRSVNFDGTPADAHRTVRRLADEYAPANAAAARFIKSSKASLLTNTLEEETSLLRTNQPVVVTGESEKDLSTAAEVVRNNARVAAGKSNVLLSLNEARAKRNCEALRSGANYGEAQRLAASELKDIRKGTGVVILTLSNKSELNAVRAAASRDVFRDKQVALIVSGVLANEMQVVREELLNGGARLVAASPVEVKAEQTHMIFRETEAVINEFGNLEADGKQGEIPPTLDQLLKRAVQRLKKNGNIPNEVTDNLHPGYVLRERADDYKKAA